MGDVIPFRQKEPSCRLVQQSKVERDIDALRRASCASPNDVLLKSRLADALFKNQDWDQAYNVYQQCSEMQPLHSKFLYYSGLCLCKLNGYRGALVLFARAINLPKCEYDRISSAMLFCLSKLRV